VEESKDLEQFNKDQWRLLKRVEKVSQIFCHVSSNHLHPVLGDMVSRAVMEVERVQGILNDGNRWLIMVNNILHAMARKSKFRPAMAALQQNRPHSLVWKLLRLAGYLLEKFL
jgi:hypothetical protein